MRGYQEKKENKNKIAAGATQFQYWMKESKTNKKTKALKKKLGMRIDFIPFSLPGMIMTVRYRSKKDSNYI